MERNKREITKHLEDTHGRLATRITQMERRTKDQFSNLSNSMKENFAQVRNQMVEGEGCEIYMQSQMQLFQKPLPRHIAHDFSL